MTLTQVKKKIEKTRKEIRTAERLGKSTNDLYNNLDVYRTIEGRLEKIVWDLKLIK